MSDEASNEELPEIGDEIDREEPKELESSEANGIGTATDLGLVMEVPLRLSVEVGSASLLVREVLALSKGSVVELDRMTGEPADVYANDRLIARGKILTEGDRVSIRITELVSAKPSTSVG